MKRISLFLVVMLAMLALMALPAFANHDRYDDDHPYYDEYGRCDTDGDGRYDDDSCYKGWPNDRYNDDRYDDDRYPPGYYNDRDEPREPYCDWYGPYGRGNNAWWEYWCYWPGWGWEFVFWAWA